MSSPQDSNTPSGADPRVPDPTRGQRPPGSPTWGAPPAGGWGQPVDADAARAWGNQAAGPWNPPAAPAGAQPSGQTPQVQLPPGQSHGTSPPAGQSPPGQQHSPAGPPPWPGWAPQGTPGLGAPPGPSGPGPAGPGGPGGPYPPQAWSPYARNGQPPWGPGYPPPPQPPKKRHTVRLIVAGTIAAALVVAAVLGFVTPGFFVTHVFDARAVESGVARIMSENYGIEGDIAVECPEGVEVTEGATFTCNARVDGAGMSVPIRVTSAEGDYEVGRPV